MKNWLTAHAQEFSGELLFDEPLSRHTYYRIGGPADVLASPRCLADLKLLLRAIQETSCPFFLLGAGSNVLVSDSGFRGLVIHTAKMNSEVHVLPNNEQNLLIKTGTSLSVAAIIRRAMQDGWQGFEFLCGIPGTIGGAVFMNAGTQLGDAGKCLHRTEIIPLTGPLAGEIQTVAGDALRFEYRKNLFLPPHTLIWSAEWKVTKQAPELIQKTLTATLERRKETQPLNFPSCGSVFKNPANGSLKAWQVVTQLGLRGHRFGDAQISVKHSNFIVNLGRATASDVMALVNLIQTRARQELGIELELEVQLVGDFSH